MIEFKETTISDIPTGDPFVDAGGNALKYWKERQSDISLIQVIEEITEIYIKPWESKINAVFLNSKITHPSRKDQAKLKETVEYYHNIITLKNGENGHCRICGCKGLLFTTGRDQFCLSGSGHFVNYHHAHEEGIKICKDCSIKLFFLPITVISVGGKLALIQTTTQEGKNFWIEETVQQNIDKIGVNSSNGVLKSNYKNPRNAIFYYANRIIEKINNTDISDTIQLYHFTNFGATPECDFFIISNPVFSFLSKAYKLCKKEWALFIKQNYYLKNATWDIQADNWHNSKTNENIKEENYINNYNSIFQKLLESKSILKNLKYYYLKKILNKKNVDSLMATLYVWEVLKMKKEQVDLIKKIAQVIFNIGQKKQNLSKYLYMIEGAGKAYQLRLALIKIIKDNYLAGGEQPVIRLDEYVNYLFPDGQFWGEVRDLMLIYLYEKMHDEKIDVKEIPDLDIHATDEELINEL